VPPLAHNWVDWPAQIAALPVMAQIGKGLSTKILLQMLTQPLALVTVME
jgi:hypothetical protein